MGGCLRSKRRVRIYSQNLCIIPSLLSCSIWTRLCIDNLLLSDHPFLPIYSSEIYLCNTNLSSSSTPHRHSSLHFRNCLHRKIWSCIFLEPCPGVDHLPSCLYKTAWQLRATRTHLLCSALYSLCKRCFRLLCRGLACNRQCRRQSSLRTMSHHRRWSSRSRVGVRISIHLRSRPSN